MLSSPSFFGSVLFYLFTHRDDRAAEKAASVSGAALKAQLSRLLLHDMGTMRNQGIFNWKKHYDTAVTLCNQAIAALAAREAGLNKTFHFVVTIQFDLPATRCKLHKVSQTRSPFF